MEALGFGAGGADRRVFHRVGEAAEVNGEALGSDLTRLGIAESADTGAGGALQQRHGAAFLYGSHGLFQRCIGRAVVSLCHSVFCEHGGGQQRQCQNQRHQDAKQFFLHFDSLLFRKIFGCPLLRG